MKRCHICTLEKPHSEFYGNKSRKDGLSSQCKSCDSQRKKHKNRDPIKAREFQRQYYASAAGREVIRKRMDKYKKTGHFNIQKRRYRESLKSRHPEKLIARTAVKNAIRSGSMVRLPCSICGDPKSEAHHEDYSKHLEVIFFCSQHHREHHAKILENIPPPT